jgi:hypothetical protein
MDVKRNIRTWKKHLFLDISSTKNDTFVSTALQVHQNPHQRSILTVVSATSAPLFQPLHHQQIFCHFSRLSCELLYMINSSHGKQETFLYE